MIMGLSSFVGVFGQLSDCLLVAATLFLGSFFY